LDTSDFVTIYYDQLTDLFTIVDSKSNCFLDFGITTEVKYAEIFAYKSSGTLKSSEICLSPNQQVVEDSPVKPSTKSPKSKELEVYEEKFILSSDEARSVLKEKYGSNFIAVTNSEFKIGDWQSAKKIEHVVYFGIPESDSICFI